jgi:thioredoxin 1
VSLSRCHVGSDPSQDAIDRVEPSAQGGMISCGYLTHRRGLALYRGNGSWFLSQCRNFSCNANQQEPIMASDLIKHVTDATFETDVLKAPGAVLVDYWAEWCGPCKMIAPVLDEISTAYQGKLQVAKMNVDENRDIPAKFGIRGIPTLMLFKNGELAATKVGAMSKAQLTAFIDQQLV